MVEFALINLVGYLRNIAKRGFYDNTKQQSFLINEQKNNRSEVIYKDIVLSKLFTRKKVVC